MSGSHGGSRAGAGRKKISPDEKKRTYTITLAPEDAAMLKAAAKKEGKTLGKFIVDLFRRFVFYEEKNLKK